MRDGYTPTANYRLVDSRIAKEHPGAALTGLQPAANLVGGTPDVNRRYPCPTIAMNSGEFGRANQ